MEKFYLEGKVSSEQAGLRLDQVASSLFPSYSRARLQLWIKAGNLLVDGDKAKNKQKLLGGELITLSAIQEPQEQWQAEPLPLEIMYEDESLLVINKVAGLVVHPAAGNYSGTLLNALLYHYPELGTIPRAGIVHRLDKETSGLMVVARTLESHRLLTEQIQAREVNREYQAVAIGLVTAGGTVDAPLGRHPVHRTKRAVVAEKNGKNAVTHYRVLKKYRAHTHLLVKLETGRTHQIRVHMAHLGFPLIGDQVYGGRPRIPKAASPELISMITNFKRQALHAWKLGLQHPGTGEFMAWEAELPQDMLTLLSVLNADYEQIDYE
ncbi:MAG: 23S rRNA pseudouridine(1911/1915/1917) synthase RluD [SAR86 cluster bacterium]|uniref:Pseudouridine synthase n=1 Tax=SAR86 cluster bacterium TaxID=2030880 RepID=A0A2A5CFI0_9GAMM|nr:MAG: 23S rRNA pseudouridine(1911/1915/1917) synthase RluD [SAR86 cluster bacterium]